AVPRQSISSRSGSTIAVLAVAPISAGVGKEERTAPAPESAVEVPSGHTGQFLADLPHSIDTAAATSPSPVKKPSPPPTSAPTPQESSHSTALVSSENSPALSF